MSTTSQHLNTGQRQPNLWLGTWRLCDPKISLASIASMFLGACISSQVAPLNWQALTLTAVGILMLEAAKNASGEVVDLDSGTDIMVSPADFSPFSGGKRVIVDGLLNRRQTLMLSAIFYTLGIGIGLWIVATLEPKVLILGILGVSLAFFYHAPPIKLAYRGCGEIAVAMAYGPLICGGTVLVQLGSVHPLQLLPSLPLGLLIAAFLLINEFPDHDADLAAGKKNLVVRLGRDRSKILFHTMQATAYLGIATLPLLGLPSGIWFGLVGLPVACVAAHRLRTASGTHEIIPAQKLSLISFMLAAAGSGIGIFL